MSVERVVRDELREVAKSKCADSEDGALHETRPASWAVRDVPSGVVASASCLLIKRQGQIERRPECEENVLLSHHGHQRACEPERYNAWHGPALAHAQPDRHEKRDGECRAGV